MVDICTDVGDGLRVKRVHINLIVVMSQYRRKCYSIGLDVQFQADVTNIKNDSILTRCEV